MPTRCPGCGLELPGSERPGEDPAFNASPECVNLYGEVIAYGMAHPARLARWHQTCTDAYRMPFDGQASGEGA
jgi:hypothetical protein